MKRFSLSHNTTDDPSAPLMEAIRLAAAFATENRLSEGLAIRLGIIVEELVSNAIKHGPVDGRIDIDGSLAMRNEEVWFELVDSGHAFDPRTHQPPDRPPAATGGGAGIPLVRAWADIEDYSREAGRNRLILVIRPDPA